MNSTVVTRRLPSPNSDCGKVLYALFIWGAQTRDQLFANSGCFGISPRVHDLRHEYLWPIYTTMESVTRRDNKVVDIARYHLNWELISMNDPAIQSFIATCKALYD